jgi:5'-3' exonuclease
LIARPRALLIDGTACLYRGYFAIRSLIARDGSQANAVYGYMQELIALLEEWRPDYAAAAFDVPGEPTFRHRLFAGYKRHRPAMPERLAGQLEPARAASRALGVPTFALPGWEADDLLSTLVRFLRDRQVDCLVVGADKDLAQLVGPGVWLCVPGRSEPMDAEAVRERYGVPPERIPDLLALRGDTSDGIPGVPGFGERTARRLLSASTSGTALMDDLSNHDGRDPQDLPGVRQLEMDGGTIFERNRELTTLRADAPLSLTEDAVAYRGIEPDAFRMIGERFGFDRLRERLREFAEMHDPGDGLAGQGLDGDGEEGLG